MWVFFIGLKTKKNMVIGFVVVFGHIFWKLFTFFSISSFFFLKKKQTFPYIFQSKPELYFLLKWISFQTHQAFASLSMADSYLLVLLKFIYLGFFPIYIISYCPLTSLFLKNVFVSPNEFGFWMNLVSQDNIPWIWFCNYGFSQFIIWNFQNKIQAKNIISSIFSDSFWLKVYFFHQLIF